VGTASIELSTAGFVRAQAFAATLSPCAWRGPWSVCALVSAVRISAESQGTVVSRSGATWYGALGAGAGFEWPEQTRLALLARASVSLHWEDVAIMLDDAPVWTAPTASGALAVGAVARF
jgi:hypothetical protein